MNFKRLVKWKYSFEKAIVLLKIIDTRYLKYWYVPMLAVALSNSLWERKSKMGFVINISFRIHYRELLKLIYWWVDIVTSTNYRPRSSVSVMWVTEINVWTTFGEARTPLARACGFIILQNPNQGLTILLPKNQRTGFLYTLTWFVRVVLQQHASILSYWVRVQMYPLKQQLIWRNLASDIILRPNNSQHYKHQTSAHNTSFLRNFVFCSTSLVSVRTRTLRVETLSDPFGCNRGQNCVYFGLRDHASLATPGKTWACAFNSAI